jgi:hypothetical protein
VSVLVAPVPQTLQLVAPVSLLNVPVGHLRQSSLDLPFLLFLKVPAGHLVALELPAGQ